MEMNQSQQTDNVPPPAAPNPPTAPSPPTDEAAGQEAKPSPILAIMLTISTAVLLSDAAKGLKLLLEEQSMGGEQKVHAMLALRHVEDAMSRLDRVSEVGRRDQLAALAKKPA